MLDVVLHDLMTMPDVALDDRIRELELQRRRLDAEMAAAVAVAEYHRLGATDGHRTVNSYLRATLNCSSSEATRLRSLGRAVDHVDGLGDAWLAGRFGNSQAVRFAGVVGNRRVRDRLLEFAPMLLDDAEQLSYGDFSTCVDRFVTQADEDGAHDARDDAIEHRDARGRSVGGALDISAAGGDGSTAAELIAIHQRFTEAEYRADLDARRAEFGDDADVHPLPRDAGQRRFDAMAEIFRRAAGTDGLGSSGDPLVNVVVDDATWARILAESGLAPETTLDGEPVDPFTGLARPSELLGDLVSEPGRLHDVRCDQRRRIPPARRVASCARRARPSRGRRRRRCRRRHGSPAATVHRRCSRGGTAVVGSVRASGL